MTTMEHIDPTTPTEHPEAQPALYAPMERSTKSGLRIRVVEFVNLQTVQGKLQPPTADPAGAAGNEVSREKLSMPQFLKNGAGQPTTPSNPPVGSRKLNFN